MCKKVDTEFLREKSKYLQKEICKLASEEKIDHIHIGGLLSAVNLLVALFYKYLRFDINDLDNKRRDKFIPSKAHCAVLLYLIFIDIGLYEKSYVFEKYKQFGHPFYQVPNKSVSGIELSTGSLGIGLSVGVGMALANRADGITSKIFCLTGDGEMQEGSNWEAIMYAGSHHLSNLVCIMDDNQCTASFRYGDNIIADWKMAFTAFGWNVIEADGTNIENIISAFEAIGEVVFSDVARPSVIIARTRKGQNVDFIQGPGWHYGHLSEKSMLDALACIDKNG